MCLHLTLQSVEQVQQQLELVQRTQIVPSLTVQQVGAGLTEVS